MSKDTSREKTKDQIDMANQSSQESIQIKINEDPIFGGSSLSY